MSILDFVLGIFMFLSVLSAVFMGTLIGVRAGTRGMISRSRIHMQCRCDAELPGVETKSG